MEGGRVVSGSQGLSTTPAKTRAARRHQGSLSPGHQALPRGQDEAGLGCGPVGGPAQLGSWPGRSVGSWRLALLQHCWLQGLMAPGGWHEVLSREQSGGSSGGWKGGSWPWTGGEIPGGWAGTVKANGVFKALTMSLQKLMHLFFSNQISLQRWWHYFL